MMFCSDDRAQSLQVGAILLFGFIVLALTLYQTQGVPAENKQVEFEHNQQVADEMVEVYNAFLDTVFTGEPRTASITLGTSYNNRLYFIYPPPASGTLQTTEPKTVQLHNVTAVTDSTNQSYDNYWNNETRNYTTQHLTYQPNYRELEGAADFRIEYGMLAAEYPELTKLRLAESHQPIIYEPENDEPTEINLVLINGSLQSVDTDAKSILPHRVTDETTITVKNDTEGPITLELPTGLPEASWNTSNSDSALYNQPNVENVSVSGGVAEIKLDETEEEYDLTLHRVDVGSEPVELEPTYLQNATANGTYAFNIRDQFNDLVGGEREVTVYNATGAANGSVTVEGGTFEFTDPIDGCGVSMADDIGSAEPYENISFTPSCP